MRSLSHRLELWRDRVWWWCSCFRAGWRPWRRVNDGWPLPRPEEIIRQDGSDAT